MNNTDIAIIGMGVMGRNLALNFASKGYKVTVYNRTLSLAENVIKDYPEADFSLAENLDDLVCQLKKPRKILIMVKAGNPVDSIIDSLSKILEPGDIIIDGGNSFFKDTQRRYEKLKEISIGYMGLGVSGGETGARFGPALMPGSDREVYEHLKKMLDDISAKAPDETPCDSYISTGGAGHFVKMVHNGIEYAEMQIIAEIYDVLHNIFKYTNAQISDLFSKFNDDRYLKSYLMEISSNILRVKDPRDSKRELIDSVLDIANQKGTGKWTSIEALDLGVDSSILTSALNARYMSMMKNIRVEAFNIYNEDENLVLDDRDKEDIEKLCYDSLLAGKIMTYAQGFSIYKKASEKYGWDLKYDMIASSFRAGCIIRSSLLEYIMQAYKSDNDLENLIFDPDFSKMIKNSIDGLRKFNIIAISKSISIPSISASLTYFDSITRKRSTANFVQSQRDYFGAHTYQRIDDDGVYHMNWEEVSTKNIDGKEVRI